MTEDAPDYPEALGQEQKQIPLCDACMIAAKQLEDAEATIEVAAGGEVAMGVPQVAGLIAILRRAGIMLRGLDVVIATINDHAQHANRVPEPAPQPQKPKLVEP